MYQLISKYLSQLILIPAIMLVAFLLLESLVTFGDINAAKSLNRHASFALVTNQLVHELQKERGMSAGFVGSKGAKFADKLVDQRKLTDKALKNVKDTFTVNTYDEAVTKEVNVLISDLRQLDSVRRNIDNLNYTLPQVLSFYTKNNTLILQLNGTLADYASFSDVKQELIVLFNFAFGKEQAGIERAVLSNGFGKDSFDDSLFARFLTLVVKQNTYLNEAETFSKGYSKSAITEFFDSSENKEVLRYRGLLDSKRSGFNVNPETWFQASTSRINLLKVTQDRLLDNTINNAEQLVSEKYLQLTMFATVSVIAIALAYALFMTTSLSNRQAKEIARKTKALIQNKDLTEEIEQITQDRLGRTANYINSILKMFREDLRTFQEYSYQIAAATHQTAVSMNQNQDNLVKQQEYVNTIAETTKRMHQSVTSVNDAMGTNADITTVATQDIQAGNEFVMQSVKGIESLAGEVQELGATITDLNNRTATISSMVDVIQSVAEQTNLLALNAAIEAARAGEQGRGFAVVADEVRALASRTRESTEEISSIVSQLMDSSSKAHDVIQRGIDKADNASNDSGEIKQVLDTIVGKMKEVKDVTTGVFEVASEQMQGINDITSNVTDIDNQAAENVLGAQQIGEATKLLADISTDMKEKVSAYQV
jgi:methyl-accepting chemotaxis protein